MVVTRVGTPLLCWHITGPSTLSGPAVLEKCEETEAVEGASCLLYDVCGPAGGPFHLSGGSYHVARFIT